MEMFNNEEKLRLEKYPRNSWKRSSLSISLGLINTLQMLEPGKVEYFKN